ncbi:MAG: pyruvate formate lyase-activating protein [Clostridia bacterium]|nr:pyruvate formate lyase-activating protein [Clostridia bacterium]
MEDLNRANYGKIHSYESFGTVDGPGIRFVIFMQGCPLRCKYCHNRDSWNLDGGHVVSVNELFYHIMRFKNYFIPSGGGVTITGGEPLLQAPFLISLFKKLKEENIHTCIDTSGMFELTDKIKELLSLTDLVLLDIKHINSKKCKDLVGFYNEKELAFARYLSDHNIPMWIRQVLVPGITDNEDDLKTLKTFINSLETVQKVEILPYHEMGKYKWEDLGYKYDLEAVRSANNDDVERAKKILGI